MFGNFITVMMYFLETFYGSDMILQRETAGHILNSV